MRRLSPTLIVLLLFILVDSLAFYGAYIQRKAAHAPVALSALAPDVEWKAFDGSTHRLKDLRGHSVVLHFWASWCLPCRDEFPKLLQAAVDNPDIMFLTVSSDESRQKAQQFIDRVPAVSGIRSPGNMLYAWDPGKTLTYDQFLTARYPETILIDASGRMRRKFPASVDWGGRDARDYLKELETAK